MEKSSYIKENFLLVEPHRILAALRKNIIYILLGTLAFALFAVYIVKKDNSKTWSATSKIIRYSKQISQSSDVPYQFQDFNYETALETIRSRSNLQELIERLDLNGTATPESLFSKFEIKRGRNSDIVEIIYTSSVQALAAKGANELSKIFIEKFNTVQNAAIERIYTYYDKSRELEVIKYQAAKKDIDDFLRKHGLTSLENELQIQYALLNKLKLQEQENEANIMEYNTSITEITTSLKSLPEEVKLRYAVRSANKKALELKLKELERQKQVYTEEHPKIMMLRSEVSQLKDTIASAGAVEPDEVTYGTNPMKSELRIILGKTKIKYITAKDTTKILQEQIKAVQKKLNMLTTLQQEYEKLIRKKNELKAQLDMVSNRLYDLKISIGSSKEDFKLFELAKKPHFPNPSYKKTIVILLTFAGLFLSTLFIMIREFLDKKMKTRFDLEKRFGIKDTVALPQQKGFSLSNKKAFSFLANQIIGQKISSPHIITLGADIIPKSSTSISSMLLEHLIYQGHKVLHIQSAIPTSNSHVKHRIDLVQSPDKQLYTPEKTNENVDTLYWDIQDDFSVFIPNETYLENTFKSLKALAYDYIVIDIPPYKGAEHLVPMFITYTDTFLLYVEFKTSKRNIVHDLMSQIDEKHIYKIKGVISEVHKYFLS